MNHRAHEPTYFCHTCNVEIRNAIRVDDQFECPVCGQHFVEIAEHGRRQASPRVVHLTTSVQLSPLVTEFPFVHMLPPALDINQMMSAFVAQLSAGQFAPPPRGIDVATLETATITEADLDQLVSRDCAVCQSEFVAGDHLTSLPCGHSYHQHCITPWFETHDTCPVCRARVS
ncbi:RING-type E3 ubiquitin transferase [Plasmodiophora brassicae]|uniref:RING-type domain-containing protein n=1 Tax=Plasmodiophora brassicae TaxID=37360 RepID=A0A0G4IRG4_PLABS|nr:hypothetical protein PBRA_005974 [Plasmodiophora brassicae]SPQ98079.1 unnamed protein product [Plasmodiophora brassicae]